jgi:hypothetical protein
MADPGHGFITVSLSHTDHFSFTFSLIEKEYRNNRKAVDPVCPG